MSQRRSVSLPFLKAMEFLSVELAKSAERDKWRRAMKTGDLATALKFMNRDQFSASVPTTVTGEAPLKTILLSDGDSSVFAHQQTLAGVLMAKGAELRVPDKYGMVIADWAMLSGNRETAYRVVKETIRQYHEAGRKQPYKPHVEPFFATCTDRDMRSRRYDNFFLNHRYIARCLIDDAINNNPRTSNGYENYLSVEDNKYWSKPLRKTQADMPYYTVDLIRAAKTKTQEVEMAMDGIPLSNRDSWLLDVEEAHDRLYCAQLKRLQAFRNSQRAMNSEPR